ncbi:MAG: carbohydrate kinase family protein, partial [Blastochloris sp.]|nr:carbohydrate kinase family protein [Blastochloris sp.]
MATVTVVGNANIETTIRVEGFPLAYQPTRFAPFGMASTVSAVGYNLTKALSTLGHTVRLASIIGPDLPGQLIQAQMQDLQLDLAYLVPIA